MDIDLFDNWVDISRSRKGDIWLIGYAELFEDREELLGSDKVMRLRYDRAFSLIQDLSFDKVLDVGCGEGIFSNRLRKLVNSDTGIVWGIDISVTAINQAKRHFGNLFFQVAPITAIPFSDSAFDLVSCLDVIYYLDDAERRKAVDELHRVLKIGGYLLISTSWPRFTKTRTGQSYIKPKELLKLLGDKFTLEKEATTSTLLNLGFMRSGVAFLLKKRR